MCNLKRVMTIYIYYQASTMVQINTKPATNPRRGFDFRAAASQVSRNPRRAPRSRLACDPVSSIPRRPWPSPTPRASPSPGLTTPPSSASHQGFISEPSVRPSTPATGRSRRRCLFTQSLRLHLAFSRIHPGTAARDAARADLAGAINLDPP